MEREIGGREKELRRRGLFNSNLPTQSMRLSVCPSAQPSADLDLVSVSKNSVKISEICFIIDPRGT